MPACYLQPPPGRACMQCVFCCPNERLLARVFNKVQSESEEEEERGRKRWGITKLTGATKGETKTDKTTQSTSGCTGCWFYSRSVRFKGAACDWSEGRWVNPGLANGQTGGNASQTRHKSLLSQRGPWGFLLRALVVGQTGVPPPFSCRSAQQFYVDVLTQSCW